MKKDKLGEKWILGIVCMCMRHNLYKKMAAKNCFAEVIGISIMSGRHSENRILNTDVWKYAS